MSVEFDFSDFERLSESIKTLGDKSEDTLNESLDKHGETTLVPEITKLIKVSRNRKGSGIREKVHAKHSKWSKTELGNLELTVKSKGGAAKNKGSYGYLVFPNEGRGPQNHVKQEFMERGADKGTPALIDHLEEDLIKKIGEEL